MAPRLTALSFQGLLLFLFIPLVLFLFLRHPLGPGWSVWLGLAIMAGHRFVAAPWMAKFADVRCLWCGRLAGEGRMAVAVVAGGRRHGMVACCADHAAAIGRFLDVVHRYRLAIAAGIFIPLVAVVGNSLAAAAGHAVVSHDTATLFFRVVVALTVVATSLGHLAGRGAPAPPARCPFPLHNLFLLGIGNTLWVFRVVGAWWLADALVRAVR